MDAEAQKKRDAGRTVQGKFQSKNSLQQKLRMLKVGETPPSSPGPGISERNLYQRGHPLPPLKAVAAQDQADLLKIEFSRARRYDYPLTCALFQIDRIDNLKDLYGYKIRDRIEEQVVGVVHQLSRTSDFLGKMGERMVLILPHTDGDGVRVLMSRVQERLQELSFEIDERPDDASGFRKLAAGRVDAVYSNRERGRQILEAEGLAESVRYAGGHQGILYYAGFAKSFPDQDLIDRFDAAWREVFRRGEAQRIIESYGLEPAELE